MNRFHTCGPFVLLAAGLLLGALSAPVANASFNPDLAIATVSPEIGVYCKGDGAGGFTCNQIQGDVADSFGVAAGDIDGDHHLDLVFANVDAKNGICYESATPDTYECSNVTFDGSLTGSVALGYVDADESLDIVFANAGTPSHFCRWIGMGLFDCSIVEDSGSDDRDVALGDVNGDGLLDALFATGISGPGSVCLGDGLGGFRCDSIAGAFSSSSVGIALGDFNQDSRPDVVLSHSEAPNQICSGNGDGTFVCEEIDLTARRSLDVAVGEFNGDDDPDLVFANSDEVPEHAGLSRVCFGGSGISFSCEDLPAGLADSFGVAVADWNRDGADDIAIANNGSASRICLGSKKGVFTCSNISGDSYDARGITAIVPPPIHPVENDFRIDSGASPSVKIAPAVSSAANRGSVIAWISREGLRNEVFARVYDTEGQSISDIIAVETSTGGQQFNPDVAMAPDGSFVIAWSSDDTFQTVAGRRFDASGTPIGPEFRVPTRLLSDEFDASAHVAITPDGSFLIAWVSLGNVHESETSVLGRLYDADGEPQGDEFVIDQQTPVSHDVTGVAGRPDGSFVVAWQSRSQDGGDWDVFARIVRADGSMPDDEFQVSTNTIGDQESPSVAADDDGNFVIAWESPQELGGIVGIRARVFKNNAKRQNEEFAVHEPNPDRQAQPSVAFGAGGRFIVAWQNFHTARQRGEGVLAQEFEPSGRKVGAQFDANRAHDEIGDIEHPDVTGARDGRIIFVWSEDISAGTTRKHVYRRRFEDSNVNATTGTTTTTLDVTTTTLISTSSTTTTTVSPTTTSTTVSTTTSSSTTTTLPFDVCGDPIDGAPPPEFGRRSGRSTAATVTASDALYILSAAVGAVPCELCLCDVDDSGTVTAVDALATLQSAIGLDVELICPVCLGA